MSKKIQVSVPKSWDELSEKQLAKIAALIYSGVTGKQFDHRAFMILCDVKWWQLRKLADLTIVRCQVPMPELRKEFQYIYEESGRTIFPRKVNGYFSPMNRIVNLTAKEFAIADDLHIKFRETKDVEYLHYLMATLYTGRPIGRPELDKNLLPAHSGRFTNVPIETLLAVELTWAGCKNLLPKKFPNVFPKARAGVTTAPNKKNPGFGKIILALAGGKFGNLQQTENTNIYTFLEEYNEILKAAKTNGK